MKNIKIFSKLKNNKYKLYTGIVGVATLSSIIVGNKIMPNNQESSKVSSENKIEEIQEQSKINITYNSSNLIDEKDTIVLIRDENVIADAINIKENDTNNYNFVTTPGNYKLISDSLGIIEIELNSQEEVEVYLDYESKTINIINSHQKTK